MKRILRWTGIVIAVLLIVIISLPFLINVNQFKPTLESSLSAALGREVKLGNLKLSILSGEVTADDLSVADDPHFGKPAFVRAKSLKVGVELLPFLLSRKLNVTEITLDQPEIVLVQAPTGDWNFSSLGGKAAKSAPLPPAAPDKAAPGLSVQLVRITNGRLTLGRTVGHRKPLVLEQVNIKLRNFSNTTAFPFSLSTKIAGGGSLNLTGRAGPINQDDAAMTPVSATLHMVQLDVAGSGMNDAAPEFAGLVSFDAAGESDGRTMHLKGKLKAEKLKLAKNGAAATRPVELDFAVDHDLRKHAGTVRQGDIHIGSATAAVTGTYAEEGESMVVHMKLNGPNMALPELAAMLPAMGVVLPAGTTLQGGTASVALSMEGPADKLVSSGSLAVANTRLAGFDLPKRMASIEKLAGIKGGPDAEIQELSVNFHVAPEGTTAQEIRLILPAIGALTGAGTVSPAKALDFKMSATVQTSGLAAVVRNTPIPFTVQGTCAEPVFHPDVKAVVKEEVKGAAGGLLKGLMGGKKK
jgi:AsmA protein